MAVYNMLVNQTVASAAPTANTLVVQPVITQQSQPATYQAFTGKITGTGALSATVQIMVSNDYTPALGVLGATWSNLSNGSMTISGTGQGSANLSANSSFSAWCAVLTAISGTGAAVTALMSA